MATPQQIAWLQSAYQAAKAAAVTSTGASPIPALSIADWARCAACESAQESGWGLHTPPNSHNVLGIKSFRGYPGPTVTANGTEQNANGSWTGPQEDLWRVYASMTACFVDQIHILHNQHTAGVLTYAAALNATTPEQYIANECRVWSTGILKGEAVTEIYQAHKGDLL